MADADGGGAGGAAKPSTADHPCDCSEQAAAAFVRSPSAVDSAASACCWAACTARCAAATDDPPAGATGFVAVTNTIPVN